MKPSSKKLGQEIQLFLLRQGYQVEDLAKEMGITSEGLSNLIHGRRRFKDATLSRLAAASLVKKGGLTVEKLKAFRAMDEYEVNELLLALLEFIKSGALDRLSETVMTQIQDELFSPAFPAMMADKRQILMALLKINQESPTTSPSISVYPS